MSGFAAETSSAGDRSGAPADRATGADLNAALHSALLVVPGLLRIEPRLMSSIQQIAKAGSETVPVAARTRGDRAELAVDISVDADAGEAAVSVAVQVQQVARDVMIETGYVPGDIEVSVLDVDSSSGALTTAESRPELAD